MSLVYDKLRTEGALCDAVIRIQDVDFQVHKVLLCNITPYFQALFARWTDASQGAYTIPDISPEMMRLIIQFAYTGSILVTELNAKELIMTASHFNIKGLVEICSHFLQDRMTAENCINTWQFTNSVISHTLHKYAFRYIIDHFEEVVSSEDFMELTVRELARILERNDLNVRTEITVYESMHNWITFSVERRKEHIATLLGKVRLALLTEEYIKTNVLSCPIVKSSAKCLSMISDAINLIRNIEQCQIQPPFYLPLLYPRLPNACLLGTGGWSGNEPTNAIEAYDYRTDTWTVIETTLPTRAYHGVTFLDGFVYYIGGLDRQEYFNTVIKFNLVSYEWTEVSPMHYHRCYVSVTMMDGYIYALGGFNGHLRLDTAEFYRPENNQWTLIAPMNNPRSDASCTTYNNKIYICGGFTGQEYLRTAECYNSETNQWTMISPMLSKRAGVGIVAFADLIFAVGGFDGDSRLQTVEAYNPVTDDWHTVASMQMKRSNFGIEVLEGRIFAIGGYNGTTITNNSECYNGQQNQWSEICGMEMLRSALSCCVIYGIPNMVNYVIVRENFLNFDGTLTEDYTG